MNAYSTTSVHSRQASQAPDSVDFLIREPAEQYHAKAKEYLSSHALGDFRRCPLLHRKKQLGQIPDEDRPAYAIGRALHTLTLEGRSRFEAEWAVGGPINPKTGEMFGPTTKAYAEWAAAQGKSVLSVFAMRPKAGKPGSLPVAHSRRRFSKNLKSNNHDSSRLTLDTPYQPKSEP